MTTQTNYITKGEQMATLSSPTPATKSGILRRIHDMIDELGELSCQTDECYGDKSVESDIMLDFTCAAVKIYKRLENKEEKEEKTKKEDTQPKRLHDHPVDTKHNC